MRNDRLRRNLGSEVVEGGRLVKGDPLQAPTTRTAPRLNAAARAAAAEQS
jgi:hypothetical protein